MKKQNKKAPEINQEQNKKPIFILRKFDENVKYQYELIDIIEKAKEITKNQLICLIQNAREDIGNSWLIAKLESIYDERFKKI